MTPNTLGSPLVTYVFLVEQESCDNFCHWHFWCQPELQADTNSDFAWPFNGGNKTNCATADQNVSRNLAWPGWALETVLISDKTETRNTAECFWDENIMWWLRWHLNCSHLLKMTEVTAPFWPSAVTTPDYCSILGCEPLGIVLYIPTTTYVCTWATQTYYKMVTDKWLRWLSAVRPICTYSLPGTNASMCFMQLLHALLLTTSTR